MEEHLEKMKNEIAQQQAELYDVRELDEWEEGHLKLAKHLPLSKLREEVNENEIAKDKKIYLHCRSGNRVLEAEDILLKKGFTDIIALEEGFDYLADEGFEQA